MPSTDLMIWLQERTALAVLSPEVLSAIAQIIEEQVVPANHRLVLEDTPPEAVYILKQGQLESYRTNQTDPIAPSTFLPGAVINLQELLLDQLTQQSAIAKSECHLWVLPANRFRELVTQYPEIAQVFWERNKST